MKNNKLISMTAFVLDKQRFKEDSDTAIFKVTNYAQFLSKPLQLGFFVPCYLEGNVLEEPNINEYHDGWDSFKNIKNYKNDCIRFQEAKSRVLIDGFHIVGTEDNYCQIELKNADLWITFHKKEITVENEFGSEYRIYRIEDLKELELTLTPTAIKEIYG